MVRPSASSTDSVSSVIATSTAVGLWASTGEELIPAVQEVLVVLFYDPLYAVEFVASESAATFQSNRREPVLGFVVVPLDMHVGWFLAVS